MMSGLMLSKALRMQQEKEENGLSTLQDEVVELQKSLEEKDAKITSLKEKAKKAEKKNDEATKIHNADISKIKKPDESIKELQANLEAAKRNIANKDIEKKLLEILRQLRENSFVVASLCCDILKKNFSSTSYS
jgi:peptidoglycan hydrolase CwlO-like protein